MKEINIKLKLKYAVYYCNSFNFIVIGENVCGPISSTDLPGGNFL